MRFWELFSIMRTEQDAHEHLLLDKRWSQYRQWNADMSRIVNEQDRKILDSIVPDELACAAMDLFPDRFQVRNGYLHGCPKGTAPSNSISAIEAYKRFGGTAIEDTLERGNAKIR